MCLITGWDRLGHCSTVSCNHPCRAGLHSPRGDSGPAAPLAPTQTPLLLTDNIHGDKQHPCGMLPRACLQAMACVQQQGAVISPAGAGPRGVGCAEPHQMGGPGVCVWALVRGGTAAARCLDLSLHAEA